MLLPIYGKLQKKSNLGTELIIALGLYMFSKNRLTCLKNSESGKPFSLKYLCKNSISLCSKL